MNRPSKKEIKAALDKLKLGQTALRRAWTISIARLGRQEEIQ